jgi:hypothetical protein
VSLFIVLGRIVIKFWLKSFLSPNPLRMAVFLRCDRRASELSNKAQSRACHIFYDPRNYSRVKTWIVILLRVWITFSSFFISLVSLIRCLFLSLFYLFIYLPLLPLFLLSFYSFFFYFSLFFSLCTQRNLTTHFC